LRLAPLRIDGKPRRAVPVWVVRAGNELYVRSYRGSVGAWYRAARVTHDGQIRVGDVDKHVTFAEVTDTDVNDRIDAAYNAKYGRYGASYIGPMLAARDTTLRLLPH
jgi:hypothetical protein